MICMVMHIAHDYQRLVPYILLGAREWEVNMDKNKGAKDDVIFSFIHTI